MTSILAYLGRKYYWGSIWAGNRNEKIIYLTFDDGPHPSVTPKVLHMLKEFNAKATFFCLGKNINNYPLVTDLIRQEGHLIANHSWSHFKGWKTPDQIYVMDVLKGGEVADSRIFRPPYGRIKRSQFKAIKEAGIKVVFWDVLSFDYDKRYSPEQCLQLTIKKIKNGSIVVFHDSEKAEKNMLPALKGVLKHFQRENYTFSTLGNLI